MKPSYTRNQDYADHLVRLIFETEDKQHIQAVNRVIEDNSKLTGVTLLGINFSGTKYGWNGGAVAEGTSIARELIPIMTPIHRRRQVTEMDRTVVTHLMRDLLARCTDVQGMRDAVPECVAVLDSHFSKLPRDQEPGWPYKGNQLALREFNRVLPKIEMYCALRFLY